MSDSQETLSFARLSNRLLLRGTLVALTALRIGAGRSTSISGSDLPVLRDAAGRPFIPGASLKGALRARAEALIRAAAQPRQSVAFSDIEQLANTIKTEREQRAEPNSEEIGDVQSTTLDGEQLEVPNSEEIADAQIAARRPADVALDFKQLEDRTKAIGAFKEQGRALNPPITDLQLSHLIWNTATMIDLTFGSPELAGRLLLKDAQVLPDVWFGQHEIRSGVALNRDTETAEEGLLYDYEVTPAGTRFDFELVLENAEDWQFGLVTLLLKPWERGEATIGGFRSRGLGRVQLLRSERRFIRVTGVDGVLALLQGDAPAVQLGKSVGEPADPAAKSGGQAAAPMPFDNAGELERAWIDAFIAKLRGVSQSQEASNV